MISSTKLARELNLTFILLAPPSITTVLVIVRFLLPIPTSRIISSLLIILFGLLVTLLVRRMY